MPVIETRGLSKRYGDLHALDGLDLQVDEGELFGLLGPNGAGKTTTIRVLTGQTRPDAGTARVLGVDPVADPVEVRRRVGILPEREDPPSFLTPREYLRFVAQAREMDLDRAAEAAEAWARRLDLEDKMGTLAKSLSRGQRQKTMIAQALLHDPPLVFIDEPLANLDPIVQERVKRILADARDDGRTIVLSTHNVHVAQGICTRVGILHRGKLLATVDPRDLDEGTSLLDVFLDQVDARVDEVDLGTPAPG